MISLNKEKLSKILNKEVVSITYSQDNIRKGEQSKNTVWFFAHYLPNHAYPVLKLTRPGGLTDEQWQELIKLVIE
jgi:hypothetical protein